MDLPGAVRGRQDEGSEDASGRSPQVPLAADGALAGAAGAEADTALGAGGGAGQSDVTSGAGDGAQLGGDFARGKRLRKLLRLINNQVTANTLTAFQRRILGLSFGVLLLHVAAFAAVMATLSSDATYAQELDAAGVARSVTSA